MFRRDNLIKRVVVGVSNGVFPVLLLLLFLGLFLCYLEKNKSERSRLVACTMGQRSVLLVDAMEKPGGL